MAWIWRLVVLASIVLAAPAFAETRVALVVGNGAYTSPRMTLPNPPADAKLVAALLERLGFSVDLVVDGGRERMYEALDGFATKAESADVALFYFAGHGIQDLGQNFLMPVDAELKRQRDLRDRFVPLDDVLQSLSHARGAKILVLDACRDNEAVEALRGAVPKSRSAAVSRGLAPMPRVSGMLVAFATQPGLVATDGTSANSPFTEALARHLPEPGLELRQVLTRVRIDVAKATERKQVPEVTDSLLGEIVLNPGRPGAASQGEAVSIPANTETAPANTETAFWTSVKKSPNIYGYRTYLDRYGFNGAFAAIAYERIMDDLRARNVPIGLIRAKLRATLSPPADGGVVVADVEAGGPADRAGIKSGDVVLAIDGRPVTQSRELAYWIALLPHREVELRINRDGAHFARRVKVEPESQKQ